MLVKLSSAGNPDFDQNPNEALSPLKFVQVSSFEQASKACRDYISEYNLGGGNWTGGQIEQSHKVSYNGRVWELGNTGNWQDDVCIYEPK